MVMSVRVRWSSVFVAVLFVSAHASMMCVVAAAEGGRELPNEQQTPAPSPIPVDFTDIPSDIAIDLMIRNIVREYGLSEAQARAFLLPKATGAPPPSLPPLAFQKPPSFPLHPPPAAAAAAYSLEPEWGPETLHMDPQFYFMCLYFFVFACLSLAFLPLCWTHRHALRKELPRLPSIDDVVRSFTGKRRLPPALASVVGPGGKAASGVGTELSAGGGKAFTHEPRAPRLPKGAAGGGGAQASRGGSSVVTTTTVTTVTTHTVQQQTSAHGSVSPPDRRSREHSPNNNGGGGGHSRQPGNECPADIASFSSASTVASTPLLLSGEMARKAITGKATAGKALKKKAVGGGVGQRPRLPAAGEGGSASAPPLPGMKLAAAMYPPSSSSSHSALPSGIGALGASTSAMPPEEERFLRELGWLPSPSANGAAPLPPLGHSLAAAVGDGGPSSWGNSDEDDDDEGLTAEELEAFFAQHGEGGKRSGSAAVAAGGVKSEMALPIGGGSKLPPLMMSAPLSLNRRQTTLLNGGKGGRDLSAFMKMSI